MVEICDYEREFALFIEEKRKEAEKRVRIRFIRNLMQNLNISAQDAMNALGIAPKEQKTYLSMLKKQ